MQPAMLTRVGGRPTRAACIFLRVINGLYPAGEPVAGQPLKIVE